ncbi:MAG: DUF6152 family protein [Pseudomonadota bacterium]
MTRRLGLVSAALVLWLTATALQAHHSFAMFDRTKEQVLVGEVVRWGFNSPHVSLYIKDAEGTVWGFEGAAPPSLIERVPKMDGYTFRPGDKVTIVHCPLRDGRSGGALGIVITADGTYYRPTDAGCGPDVANWKKWIEAGYTSRAQAEAAAVDKK